MKIEYTLTQWLAFFFIYCFFGWCIESTIVSVTKKKLVNRGFLQGPILPLYGFGAVFMLFSTLWIRDNILSVYFVGAVSATCLEYVTGVVMEAMFKIKYWDYSDKKFNLNGYICLRSSLFWGVLTVFLVDVIHEPISRMIASIDAATVTKIIVVVLCVAVIDCVDSFKKAFNLQKFLDYTTRIRNEISDITAKLAEMKDNLTSNKAAKEIPQQEEGVRSLEKYVDKLKSELDLATERAGAFKNTMLKSFPSATSKRFNDALQDLKSHFYK